MAQSFQCSGAITYWRRSQMASLKWAIGEQRAVTYGRIPDIDLEYHSRIYHICTSLSGKIAPSCLVLPVTIFSYHLIPVQISIRSYFFPSFL